ncbi:hypothetical protein ACFL1E_00670 [Candidatus Omnitrophota bacterium]
MMKRIYLVSFVAITMFLFSSVAFGQNESVESSVEDVDIDIDQAKKLAEKYLSLLKDNEFEQAFDMVKPLNDRPENRDIDLQALKVFHEEFGDIIDYKYRSHVFWDKKFQKNVTTGSEKIFPPYVSLSYEVQYETLAMDKEIHVYNVDGEIMIRTAKDSFSQEAMPKMMNMLKKLPRKQKEE